MLYQASATFALYKLKKRRKIRFFFSTKEWTNILLTHSIRLTESNDTEKKETKKKNKINLLNFFLGVQQLHQHKHVKHTSLILHGLIITRVRQMKKKLKEMMLSSWAFSLVVVFFFIQYWRLSRLNFLESSQYRLHSWTILLSFEKVFT